jgi:hypothetical protein
MYTLGYRSQGRPFPLPGKPTEVLDEGFGIVPTSDDLQKKNINNKIKMEFYEKYGEPTPNLLISKPNPDDYGKRYPDLIRKLMTVDQTRFGKMKPFQVAQAIVNDEVLSKLREITSDEQREQLASANSLDDIYQLAAQITGKNKKEVQNIQEAAKKNILSNPISTGLWWFVWLWIMLQSGFIITAYRKEKDNQDPQYTRQISKGLYLFAVVSMTTGWVAFILRLLGHVPMSKEVKDELEDVASGGESEEEQSGATEETPKRKSADSISGGRPGKLRQWVWKTKSDIQAMDASRANVVKTSKRMSDVYLLILWNFVLGCWAVNDTRKSPKPGTNKVVLGLGAAAIVVGVLFVLLLRIWPPIAVYVRVY